MAYEVVPAVQAVLDVFPEKKKDGFDRVMDVAHLIMDGTVGTVCSTIDSVFQTYALIQGSSALWTVAPVAYILELFPPAKIIAFISVPPFSEL